MERATSVSVVILGRAHERNNQPCQDACASDTTATRAWVALADGAGSCAHAESGARAIVANAKALLWRYRTKLNKGNVHETIVEAIRKILQSEAERLACPVTALGSTLLAVQVWRGRYVTLHLGDGVIGAWHRDGTLSVLSEPENGAYCNQTWLTTSSDMSAHLRIQSGDLGDIVGFVVMSDGAADSLYQLSTGSLAPFVQVAFTCLRNFGAKATKKALFTFMQDEMRRQTDDDISLAFLSLPMKEVSEVPKLKNNATRKAMLKVLHYVLQQNGRSCQRKKIIRNLHWNEKADLQTTVFIPLIQCKALYHQGGQIYVAGERAADIMKELSDGE